MALAHQPVRERPALREVFPAVQREALQLADENPGLEHVLDFLPDSTIGGGEAAVPAIVADLIV